MVLISVENPQSKLAVLAPEYLDGELPMSLLMLTCELVGMNTLSVGVTDLALDRKTVHVAMGLDRTGCLGGGLDAMLTTGKLDGISTLLSHIRSCPCCDTFCCSALYALRNASVFVAPTTIFSN